MKRRTKPLILFVASSHLAAKFYRGQLKWLRSRGFDVTLITGPGEELNLAGEEEGVAAIAVPFCRDISPLYDCLTLWHLFWKMRRLRPTIVHASTPKGALLGLIVAVLTRVPVRIYHARGLRAETLRGLTRRVSFACEKLCYRMADYVICDSPSLRDLMTSGLGIVPRDRTCVLNVGSCNGISPETFCITPARLQMAIRRKKELPLSMDTQVIGYVGRFKADKGLDNLARACRIVFRKRPHAKLLMVGDFESPNLPEEDTIRWIKEEPRVIHVKYTLDVVPYYMLMDVMAFPSRREGFGNVAVEASLADIPVIGTNATGVIDAVADGISGTIVPLDDSQTLARTIIDYLDDPERCRRIGRSGRLRALTDFKPEVIWQQIYDLFRELLQKKCVKTDVRLEDASGGNSTVGTHGAPSDDILAKATDLMAVMKYHVLKGVPYHVICEEFGLSAEECEHAYRHMSEGRSDSCGLAIEQQNR